MEQLYNQLIASGQLPEAVTFDDFSYMYSDKGRRSELFKKIGYNEPNDTSVTYNPYNDMVVDFNRGVVYQGGISDARKSLNETNKRKNTLQTSEYSKNPAFKDQLAKANKEVEQDLNQQEEAYISYTKAIVKDGVNTYIKQAKDLPTKVEKLGGGPVAAYEIFDEFHKTASNDIVKTSDILLRKLRNKHSGFEDFYKKFSQFETLSDEEKYEIANSPIAQDQNFKDLLEVREGYNVLEAQKIQAKSELKRLDPQRYNDLLLIEDIQKNRDDLTSTPLSKGVAAGGRLLGRTLQGVSALIPFDEQSGNIYRAGQDLINVFPTSSKSEGSAVAYRKEFDYGGENYYAEYESQDATEPTLVRNSEGYIVQDPFINKKAVQAEGEKKKYINTNSFATQTMDVLLDVGVDVLAGKGIGKAYSTAAKPSRMAYAIGTSVPAYARSYSQSYNEFIKNGDLDSNDAQLAAVAIGGAAVIINRINPLESELAEKGFQRFTADFTKKNIGKIASGEVGSKEIVEAYLRAAGKTAIGGVKETVEEVSEDQFSNNVVNPILNRRNGTDFVEGVSINQLENIALISLAAGVIGDAGALNISKNKLVNSALASISENQDIYKAWLKGVSESDPEFAARIDAEIGPITEEAAVYGDVADKPKLIEKLIKARKLEKEIKTISVPQEKEKRKLALEKVHGEIVELVNAPKKKEEEAPSQDIIPPDGGSPLGIATELGTGEGDVNPSPTFSDEIDQFIGNTSAGVQVDVALGNLRTRIDAGEDISTSELEPVRNSLYELYDKIDSDNTRSETQKESMKSFLLNEIEKLENYGFETANETSPIVKTRTIKGTTPIGTKGTELSSKYTPTADRFTGKTTTLTTPNGNVEATFTTDEEGGLYVTELESGSSYTNNKGEKVNVRFENGVPKVVLKNGNLSTTKIPNKYLDEINSNRKSKGTPVQITANAKFEPVFNESGDLVSGIMRDGDNSFTVTDLDLALDLAIAQKIEDLGSIPQPVFEETIQQYEEKPTPQYVRDNAQKPQETTSQSQETEVSDQATQGTATQENAQVNEQLNITNEQVQGTTDGGLTTPGLPTVEVSSPTGEFTGPTQPSEAGATQQVGQPTATSVQQEEPVPGEVQPDGGDVQVSAQKRQAELEQIRDRVNVLKAEFANADDKRKAEIAKEVSEIKSSLTNAKFQVDGDLFDDILNVIDSQIQEVKAQVKQDVKEALQELGKGSAQRTKQFAEFFFTATEDKEEARSQAELANRILERVASRLGARSMKSARQWINDKIKLIGKVSSKDLGRLDVKFQESQKKSIETALSRNNGHDLTKAPNGKPSKLYQSYKDLGYDDNTAEYLTSQVYSDNFIKWFGDWRNNPSKASKVIDGNGMPMLMYHGSKSNFNIFEYNRSNKTGSSEGYGFYFTDQLSVAKGYQTDGGNLFTTFLSIKNPITPASKPLNKIQLKKLLNALVEEELSKYPDEIKDYRDSFLSNFEDTYSVSKDKAINEAVNSIFENDSFVDQIAELIVVSGGETLVLQAVEKALGFDGVYVENFLDGEAKVYLAWQPNQIKSAVNNQGPFDISNPDIRFSVDGQQDLFEAVERVANNLMSSLDAMIEDRLTTVKPGMSIEESTRQVERLKQIKAELEKKRAKIQWQNDPVYRAAVLEIALNEYALLALESPNASSLIHEFPHLFEDDMTTEEKEVFIKQYNKLFDTDLDSWTTDVSEYFARTWEKYLSNGRKLTSNEIKDNKTRASIQEIFDKFTDWLQGVYEGIISYTNSAGVKREIQVTPEIQEFFDKLLVNEIPEIDTYIMGGRFLGRFLSENDLAKLERFQQNPSVSVDDKNEFAKLMVEGIEDNQILDYANALVEDLFNSVDRDGWQILAIGHLAVRAEKIGDYDLQHKVANVLDDVASRLGSSLMLLRSDLMFRLTGLRLKTHLSVEASKALTNPDDNGFTATDAAVRVTSNEAMLSPEEIIEALESISQQDAPQDTQQDAVVDQQVSDKDKAISFLASAKKRWKSIIGQANSGINPEMILVAVDLLQAAYYATKHSYKSVKSEFKKYAKEIGIEDNLINKLYQEALNQSSDIRNEIVTNDINDKIANMGKGTRKFKQDPMQVVINNIYRIYARKYSSPLEAKEKFKRDLENKNIKVGEIESAIEAIDFGVFSSDPLKAAEIKAKLEDLLSWHQDKVVGNSAIRAKLNTKSGREAVKSILEKRFSASDKDRFITTMAQDLVKDYGFTASEAALYEAEVRKNVEKALNKKIEGVERTRAEKLYLDGIGLNKNLIEKAIADSEALINKASTPEDQKRLLAERVKRLRNKLDNLEANIEKALSKGAPTIGKLLDAIASGMTDRAGIAAALSEQFGFKNTALALRVSELEQLNKDLIAAEAVNDPKRIKQIQAKIGSVLKAVAKDSDVSALGLGMNFYMNQLLSGINTGPIALISGIASAFIQISTREFGSFIRRLTKDPQMIATYLKIMPEVIRRTIKYMKYEGWPKIVQIMKGTNFDTDITKESVTKMKYAVNTYQAKLEKIIGRSLPKNVGKSFGIVLTKLFAIFLFYVPMMASKSLAVADVATKAMLLPYLAASERFSVLESQNKGNAAEVLRLFNEEYKDKRNQLTQTYVNMGHELSEAKNLADELIAHEELKGLEESQVDAIRDFIDMSTLTGQGGLFTGVANWVNSGINKTPTGVNLAIKSLTTPFLAVAGRIVDVTKYFSVFTTIGPPVSQDPNSGELKVDWKQGWKTPIRIISSNLYYKVQRDSTGAWSVKPLTENEQIAKVTALGAVTLFSSLPFLLFKKGDCKFSSNSPTGCLEPRFENFRITGKGKNWNPLDNYEPYSIQFKDEEGKWKSSFSFKNFPPLQALFAPIGYISDQYYQSMDAKDTEKPLSGLMFGAATAPFINVWDNSLVQALVPMTQLLEFVTSDDGKGGVKKDWSRTFQSTMAKSTTPYITPGGNLVTTSTGLWDDFQDESPQVAKNTQQSWYQQQVADRLADNMLYRGIFGSKPEVNAIGLNPIAEFDSVLIPSYFEKSDFDKLDYLNPREKRVYKALMDFEVSGPITNKYPRELYTKTSGNTNVDVISGLIPFSEMKDGSTKIAILFGKYLSDNVERIEKMNDKTFEGVKRMQTTFKSQVEGELLYQNLTKLGLSLPAENKFYTRTKKENLEPLTYIDPTKIVDWLVESQIQIRDGKIVKGFKYSDLIYKKGG